jgi:hypothetical protein
MTAIQHGAWEIAVRKFIGLIILYQNNTAQTHPAKATTGQALAFVREWDWLLILALLAVELLILWKIHEEKKERTILVREMRTTRVELGREKYIEMIKTSLRSATQEVLFFSHSLTTDMSAEEKKELFDSYKNNIDHRCLTGRDPRRIAAMWEQHRHGVAVRVNEVVLHSTFRCQVCDRTSAILGFSNEGDERSRKGILVENLYFARVIRDYFLRVWDVSQPFELYVKEIIEASGKMEPGLSLYDLACEWHLTPEEINNLEAATATPTPKGK